MFADLRDFVVLRESLCSTKLLQMTKLQADEQELPSAPPLELPNVDPAALATAEAWVEESYPSCGDHASGNACPGVWPPPPGW